MYLREGLFSRIAAVVIISIGTHTYDMTVGAVQQQHYYYCELARSSTALSTRVRGSSLIHPSSYIVHPQICNLMLGSYLF